MAIILEANNDFTSHVYTTKERKYIHILRTMLKDYKDDNMLTLNHLVEQDRGERWSDGQLLVYIEQGIADVNAEPPFTAFTIENLPAAWQTVCMTGALIFAILAETIKQSGESFSYSENGLALTIDVASKYQGILSALQSQYQAQKTNMKKTIRPGAAAIRTGQRGAVGANNVTIRSYAPRMYVYR